MCKSLKYLHNYWKRLADNTSLLILLLLCILAFFVRIYKIEELAIFLSDQAIDSFAVKGILEGKLTLLGPRASVGQFFNGPIVYYLMVPFYWIMGSDPLAGTFFQIVLQVISMPFLFVIGKRIGGKKVALAALLIFACSPLLIQYSRATFNSYPAIPFTIGILYILTAKKLTQLEYFAAGLLMGMMVQMHYFLYIYVGALFFYVIFLNKKRFESLITITVGVIVGLSPFLLFEFRHNFLNIRAILAMEYSMQNVGIWERLSGLGISVSSLTGVSSMWTGLFILILVTVIFLRIHIDFKYKVLYVTAFVITVGVTFLYRGYIQTHYLICFMPFYILGFATVWVHVVKKWPGLLLCIICSVNLFVLNKDIFMLSSDQDNVGIQDQRRIARLIQEWKSSTDLWNITQDAQRDNRAMPLRYLIELNSKLIQPLSVEDYLSNTELFVVAPRTKKIQNITTWEVQSFGDKFSEVKTEKINEHYNLYYLRKEHD